MCAFPAQSTPDIKYVFDTPFSLKILRTIAKTTLRTTFADTAGSTELVWLLIETGEPVTDEFFIAACIDGQTDIVHMLLDLELGVNPAALDNLALRVACLYGRTKVLRLLLDLPLKRGVNPAELDNCAFQDASDRGHTEIVCSNFR